MAKKPLTINTPQPPAASFISAPEAAQEQQNTATSTPAPAPVPEIPAAPESRFYTKPIEAKTRRVNFLMRPSLWHAFKELCDAEGISMNEGINRAVTEYVTKNLQ